MSSIYEAYAPIYDAIGQGQFSARMAAWALGWLADRGLRPTRALDLACGTGEAALAFAAYGCEVVGVDQSDAMLQIARGKARGAGFSISFVQGDIRELTTEDRRSTITDQQLTTDALSSLALGSSSFDLVTCFYDSLNYLIEDGDLDRAWAGVARVLRPGGYMVWDLNTAAEYATWDERDSVTYDGRDCLVYNQLGYDPATRLATGRIVWFVREIDRWWRGEETHIERAWLDTEVLAALDRARLELVGQFDTSGALATQDATRAIYVARRLND
jgi:SAM-dependent methyltransferase